MVHDWKVLFNGKQKTLTNYFGKLVEFYTL